MSLESIGKVKFSKTDIEINYKPDHVNMRSIIETLHKTKLDIKDLSTKEISLEDIFINLTRTN